MKGFSGWFRSSILKGKLKIYLNSKKVKLQILVHFTVHPMDL